MKSVGIFEAKTHFPGLCDEVSRRGEPILISRRGRPLVMIGPIPQNVDSEKQPIYEAWLNWTQTHDETEAETDFPKVEDLRDSRSESPLDD